MAYVLMDKTKGQVFTPEFLAHWAGQLVNDHIPNTASPKILDPACGDGELLVAAQNIFSDGLFYGVDIDPNAISRAQQRIRRNASLIVSNVLENPFYNDNELSRNLGQFDAIISNPPWGIKLTDGQSDNTTNGYAFATGQFDSWCLFVEFSLRILKPKGVAVFILPDSIFSPEYSRIRHILVKRHTIDLIARLGEGVFPNIYRGTVVIALRKTNPCQNHRIEIIRLTKDDRKKVVSGSIPISYYRHHRRHFIPQSQYIEEPNKRWDIDVRANEREIIRKIEMKGENWPTLFEFGRGIEISKTGNVRSCTKCNYVIPEPRKHRIVKCKRCGNTSNSEVMPQRVVVSHDPTQLTGSIPFIVGEDVNRYSLTTTRFIELNVDGLNYKKLQTYSKERLLLRKTGIGINATITQRLAATNQVVFHIMPRHGVEHTYLAFLLGVISSRLLFAYHLKKSGEIEWRSHPYITPTIVRQLPIPIPKRGGKLWPSVEAIADCVRKQITITNKSHEIDMEIEDRVSSLYGLTNADRIWVKHVIQDAQQLKPMRTLMTKEQ